MMNDEMEKKILNITKFSGSQYYCMFCFLTLIA